MTTWVLRANRSREDLDADLHTGISSQGLDADPDRPVGASAS